MRKFCSAFILTIILFCSYAGAGSFGPRESIIIFEGGQSSSFYRIDNSDAELPWLVQAWIEDAGEKRTDAFIATPLVFRVEPSSTFTVRIMKKSTLPENRETLFWVVSHSLPGSADKGDKMNSKLSLAYRFKVPMIYRPASLIGTLQQPDSLQWSIKEKGKINVYNPSRHVVRLNYINVDGKRYQGEGVSSIISPENSVAVHVNAGTGSRIKYGVMNDYGAVHEYEGVIR